MSSDDEDEESGSDISSADNRSCASSTDPRQHRKEAKRRAEMVAKGQKDYEESAAAYAKRQQRYHNNEKEKRAGGRKGRRRRRRNARSPTPPIDHSPVAKRPKDSSRNQMNHERNRRSNQELSVEDRERISRSKSRARSIRNNKQMAREQQQHQQQQQQQQQMSRQQQHEQEHAHNMQQLAGSHGLSLNASFEELEAKLFESPFNWNLHHAYVHASRQNPRRRQRRLKQLDLSKPFTSIHYDPRCDTRLSALTGRCHHCMSTGHLVINCKLKEEGLSHAQAMRAPAQVEHAARRAQRVGVVVGKNAVVIERMQERIMKNMDQC